jgi:mannose-6-phosphate isomerase-like protein (cupin superfamily)
MEFTTQAIKEARENNKSIVFNKLFSNMPKWNKFIEQIEYGSSQPEQYHFEDMLKTVGLVHWWHQLTATIDDAHLFFDEAKENLQLIKNTHFIKDPKAEAFSALSLTSKEPTTSLHYDRKDVFYWQCIGDVRWEIGKHAEDKQIFNLSPGDVIYIPAWKHHEVFSLTPRAAISFSVNPREDDPHFINGSYDS